MSFYRTALRPLLFMLPGDMSHSLAISALRFDAPWRLVFAMQGLEVADPRLRTRFVGMDLAGPVCLAAGFDKNGELLPAISRLGFGSVNVGTIMPLPRRGNPLPRIVRYPETESLGDAMGVPSRGRAYVKERLRRFGRGRVPVVASVGGFGAEELASAFFDVEPYVDAIEISLMCPNVLAPGEHFDELALLAELLPRIEGRTKPAILRMPNETTKSPDRMAEFVERLIQAGVQGLKVGGGRRVPEPRLGIGHATLHGQVIREAALANVENAARIARGRIQIKGNGGIQSAKDVLAMMRAGASCVDLYSAFVYRGWTVARDIHRELLQLLGDRSVASFAAPSMSQSPVT